ncbi:MAG TPA: cyclic nucleotide-binding domain-containing protein [Stellaceae bacterium]|nr:cyclic nucleotide-binding domain-containing protein [Stellaceae bacterium]
MSADYRMAIVGSGPAGMSAAARAAQLGESHILLERAPHLSDTIFKYQKRKHVMATPEILPLRTDLAFGESSREEVIEAWTRGVDAAKINVRLDTEVTAIAREEGGFVLSLGGGNKLTAEVVILAIGVQGNLNKLTIPGAELPFVQYQLDDPDEYSGEEISIIGVGDAGIENALALAANNLVSVVNTGIDFPRAKRANADLIEAAIKRGQIQHVTDAKVNRIEPGGLVLDTKDGETRLKCDRIIARIGAAPPRRFVESCGIQFPSDNPVAFPEVSDTYESQVPGLYIIGALAGYPLIKHCLNQGYEVVEYVRGNRIPPADEPLIQAKLDRVAMSRSVSDLVATVRELPLFASLTPLQIREILIHAELHSKAKDEIVIERGEYANSVYSVLEGEVGIRPNIARPEELVRLGPGKFFGELALLMGRRRTRTVIATAPSLLLEVDRNTMVRLVRSVPEVKRVIDDAAIGRYLKVFFAPNVEDALLADVVGTAEVIEFKQNDTLIEAGARDDSVYFIRTGSVTISYRVGGQDIVRDYVPAGNYVGEMALLMGAPRSATVKAAVATEAIRIDSAPFRALLERAPDLRREVERHLQQRLALRQRLILGQGHGDVIGFLMRQGVGEATDVLLIDESLCVRCDNCEKACAETHNGVSRLDREAGPTYATLHVPTSCRHCEHPHCMKDCPPDAIHRAPNGEVYIGDNCIGCGNCERNCPYGVIQMAALAPEKPGLLSWLFWGSGHGPGEDRSPEALAQRTGGKHAVKCDMCKGIEEGPACVRACPTGAAIRVAPERFIDVIRDAGA